MYFIFSFLNLQHFKYARLSQHTHVNNYKIQFSVEKFNYYCYYYNKNRGDNARILIMFYFDPYKYRWIIIKYITKSNIFIFFKYENIIWNHILRVCVCSVAVLSYWVKEKNQKREREREKRAQLLYSLLFKINGESW